MTKEQIKQNVDQWKKEHKTTSEGKVIRKKNYDKPLTYRPFQLLKEDTK